jgi:hypothetical protein
MSRNLAGGKTRTPLVRFRVNGISVQSDPRKEIVKQSKESRVTLTKCLLKKCGTWDAVRVAAKAL